MLIAQSVKRDRDVEKAVTLYSVYCMLSTCHKPDFMHKLVGNISILAGDLLFVELHAVGKNLHVLFGERPATKIIFVAKL